MKKKKATAKPRKAARAQNSSGPTEGAWQKWFAHLLLNANPLPAFVSDLDGFAILDVNEAAVRKYGYSRSEFLAMKITEIRPPEDIPRLKEYARTRLKGLTDAGIWRHTLKDGKIIDVHVTAHPVVWKGRKAALSIAVDISERREMATALQGAQERLGEIVTHAPIILFAADRKGTVTLCTGQALKLLGHKPGESVGKSLFDMYKDNPRMIAACRRALTGDTFTELIDVGGITFETHFSPHMENGEKSGFISVAADVTERRRADKLLHQQSAAIKASMDGMAIHDELGRFVYLNDAHARLYGYHRPEELIGKTWKELYSADELKRFEKAIMPSFWKEGQWRGESVGRRQDGSVFPQEVSLTRIEGGGLVCVVRDISERKRAEAEHERLLALEKQARAEAEAASRSKDEFLAVVSHELRTPMTAILGWTWLLRSGDVPQSERSRALEIIERNMKLQAQIIEDLLDLSSIVTGKLHLDVRPVELAGVLQAAADTIKSTAEAKSVAMQVDCEPGLSVFGDHYRLQQVFWNLLSNAVKFNRDGGKVSVRARLEQGCAAIAVADEGTGIEAKFIPEMFDLFKQGESSLTREHRGLGIGLAIVKHLVELHGGAVVAASPGVGKGATFTVTLPVSKAGAAAGNGKSAGGRFQLSHALDGLRVLVVEDEFDTRQMLAELLKHCGAAVSTASSVAEAVEALQKEKPQLLIADIAMPVEDGYSLIRRVRALGRSRGGDIPALALTAMAKEEDRKQAMQAGFQMYLPKPVEPETLLKTIRSLLDAPKSA